MLKDGLLDSLLALPTGVELHAAVLSIEALGRNSASFPPCAVGMEWWIIKLDIGMHVVSLAWQDCLTSEETKRFADIVVLGQPSRLALQHFFHAMKSDSMTLSPDSIIVTGSFKATMLLNALQLLVTLSLITCPPPARETVFRPVRIQALQGLGILEIWPLFLTVYDGTSSSDPCESLAVLASIAAMLTTHSGAATAPSLSGRWVSLWAVAYDALLRFTRLTSAPPVGLDDGQGAEGILTHAALSVSMVSITVSNISRLAGTIGIGDGLARQVDPPRHMMRLWGLVIRWGLIIRWGLVIRWDPRP